MGSRRMMDDPTYRHTAEMGEISGFGGGYEDACQSMLDAGVKWVIAHPDADCRFKGFEGVYGLIMDDNEDARALTKTVVGAVKNSSGAMHHAVISRVLWIKAHGWDAYVQECINGDKED